MGMMKQYLLKLLHQCSEEKFGQEAIEWAIVSGLVHLTYDLEWDIHETMSRYEEIIEAYRRSTAQATDTPPISHAPMERAVPRQPVKATSSNPSIKKKRAA